MWLFLFSKFPISKKSKNARMGKGNGYFFKWIIKLKKNFIFLEFFTFFSLYFQKILLKFYKLFLYKK